MILPSPEQVDQLVKQIARLGTRSIVTQADYSLAREQLVLGLNYEAVAAYSLDMPKKQRIGKSEPERCRYCGKDSSSTTFRTESHAIPECLGNKTLISDDECDACNDIFSRTFEHHLDILTRPWRTFFGIKGKSKVPTYKVRGGQTRIDHNPKHSHIKISDPERNINIIDDEKNRKLIYEIPCDPFIPMEAYRCLTKIAVAILPRYLLATYESAVNWLLLPIKQTPVAMARFSKSWMCHSPLPFQNPRRCLVPEERPF